MRKGKRKPGETALKRPKKSAAKNRGLPPREEIFALQYAADPNGTQAAIRAGLQQTVGAGDRFAPAIKSYGPGAHRLPPEEDGGEAPD